MANESGSSFPWCGEMPVKFSGSCRRHISEVVGAKYLELFGRVSIVSVLFSKLLEMLRNLRFKSHILLENNKKLIANK